MRERMIAGLAAALLLASCHRSPPMQRAATSARECRVGPDGGPAIADRGIGGTGAPALADRGIGGTGSPLVADRGIGGTGIVGVITGFASICLAGQEVALPDDATVLVNARPADPATLRAGQVAVIEAAPGADGLAARRVDIRYEAVGPVEHADGDRLQIAGQPVRITSQTLGIRPRSGDWVAVSGLREPDGGIVATRFEPSPAGPVLVHGIIEADDGALGFGTLHIGALTVPTTPQTSALLGRPVTVSGVIVDGKLDLLTVAPDVLAADPGAYFGPSIGTVFVEGFGAFAGGRLHLGPSFTAPAESFRIGPERNVFRFERAPGGLRATGLSNASAAAPLLPAPRFEPAPVPNRSISPARPSFGGGARSNTPRGPGRPGRPGFGGGNDPNANFGSGFGPGASPGAGRDGPPVR